MQDPILIPPPDVAHALIVVVAFVLFINASSEPILDKLSRSVEQRHGLFNSSVVAEMVKGLFLVLVTFVATR